MYKITKAWFLNGSRSTKNDLLRKCFKQRKILIPRMACLIALKIWNLIRTLIRKTIGGGLISRQGGFLALGWKAWSSEWK